MGMACTATVRFCAEKISTACSERLQVRAQAEHRVQSYKQTHKIVQIGRDLWRSSRPASQSKLE